MLSLSNIKNWRKLLFCLLSGILVITFTGCATMRKPEIVRVRGYGTAANLTEPSVPKNTPSAPPLQLDWADEEVSAVGHGVPPESAINEAQGRLMARRAAKVDALRNLAELVYGARIDARTTVENFITQSDVIKSQVNAIIEGARVVEERELEDGVWEVKVALTLKPVAELVQRQYAQATTPASPPRQAVVPPGQARLMAKRAAQLDAYRNLLELVKGVQIKSGTTVENFMARDDQIRSRVEGIIREARIVEENYLPDGTCEVIVEFDLNRIRQAVR